MIIGIDCGHSLNSSDYGASGIKEESNLTREVGNKVIELLTNKGHEVINCTVDYCDSLNDSLYRRYNTANVNNCDYFISIHFNAFNGSAHGTEILYCSDTDEKMERILNNFVSLGFTNRGLKQRTNLAVLKNTNMRAMLIECCFCDSAEDMNIYNVDSFSKAIVEGFLGETLSVGQTINVTSNDSIAIPMSSKSVSPTQLSPIQKAKEFVGNRCLELQKLLIAKGYDCGGYGADGSFGQGTYNSLIQYQKNNPPLVSDGLAGALTFAKLNEVVKATPIISQSPISNNVLLIQQLCNFYGARIEEDNRYGSQTENAIKQYLPLCGIPYTTPRATLIVQKILGVTEDGVFMDKTAKKVADFQLSHNLSSDSIVGFQTYCALAKS